MTTPYPAQPAGRPPLGPDADGRDVAGDEPAGAGGPDSTGMGYPGLPMPGWDGTDHAAGGWNGLAGKHGWPAYAEASGAGAGAAGAAAHTPSGWEPLAGEGEGGEQRPPATAGLAPHGPAPVPPLLPPSESGPSAVPPVTVPDQLQPDQLQPDPLQPTPQQPTPQQSGQQQSGAGASGPVPPGALRPPPPSEVPPGFVPSLGQVADERSVGGAAGPGFAGLPGFPLTAPPNGAGAIPADFGTPWHTPPLDPTSMPVAASASAAGAAGGTGVGAVGGVGPDGLLPPGSAHPGAGADLGTSLSPPLLPPTADPTGQTLRDALFDRAPVGLALYDTAGRYVRVNEVLARLNGRPAVEHLGRTMSELLGDIGQEMDVLLGRVLRTGEPVTDLEIGVATGGTGPDQTWLASWFPATDRLGTPAGAVLVAVDATRAKTAQADLTRAQARERLLVDAAAADVFHAAADGALDVDLPRWRAATGQIGPQTAGFGWLDAVHPDEREQVRRSWHGAVERGEPFDAEFTVPDVTGGFRTMTARLVPAVDGQHAEWVGVLADVTEARSAAAARASFTAAADEAAWRRDQSRRLTSALGRAVTVDDVVAAVVEHAGRAARAVSRGVALIDETGDRLRFHQLVGTSAEYAGRWSEVSLGAIHPLAEVVRGQRPVLLRSRDELGTRWPVADLLGTVETGPEHAWALVPLATTDAPFGVLHLGFPAARDFDGEDQEFLLALAEQCAQALERATLFERVAADATERRLARDESDADLATARAAAQTQQASAATARRRLEQLAQAGAAVTAAADPDRALAALAAVVVAEIADVCLVHLASPTDGSDPADGPAVRPAVFAVRDGLAAGPPPGGPALLLPTPSPLTAVAVAVADGPGGRPGPILLNAGEGSAAPGGVPYSGALPSSGGLPLPGLPLFLDGVLAPELARWVRDAEGHSAAAVPILFRGRPVGVLTVIATGERAAFTGDDLPFLTEVAARTAPALERAGRGGPAGGEARELQQALLPRLPALAGLDLAARYLPAGEADEVGGDWFDAIDLGAGRAALVIGDVMGRGLRAAALMGQLRSAVRTCARLDLPPAEVLTQLDLLVADLAEDLIATCIYAVIETETGQLTLASAGHPPPLVVAPDGLVSRLYMAVATPLGLARDAMTEYTVQLGPGSLLALFTDGLVRGRGTDIDAGVSNLAAVLARPAEDWDDRLDVLARAACAARPPTGSGSGDDVALLLARLPERDSRAEPLDVSADPGAGLSQVRAQVRVALENALLPAALIDTVVLVLSELVGNALVHGREPLSARVRRMAAAGTGTGGAPHLLIEVTDAGGRMPRRRRAGPEDETGRGLDLVGRLASRWGTRPVGDGKLVWAEIDPDRT
ncbi:SpoIIE family protein phosphatase [Parafrankia sp. FMc2]|uniref:SpoIIE family protein phosphatase n=1 Tax=Parafrankia sp. FMc2 TaxID=3233196 RepID=UPI0034D6CF5D